MHVYLLDKSIARKIVEGLRRVREDRPLPQDHIASLAFWQAALDQESDLYILPHSMHVLERFSPSPEIAWLTDTVQTIQFGRYVRRWARRLRGYGFTREDAVVLSLGTFGTNDQGSILGVEAVVTLDRPIINNYRHHRDSLVGRLAAMTRQLPAPFCDAALPDLQSPDETLAALMKLKATSWSSRQPG
ncbi:MAG TPA: hypothetical protein ENJ31_06615 [Anaerolineae bacterium]|nr:hypothetical protein [Anaerolineae bacterium]